MYVCTCIYLDTYRFFSLSPIDTEVLLRSNRTCTRKQGLCVGQPSKRLSQQVFQSLDEPMQKEKIPMIGKVTGGKPFLFDASSS